MIDGPSPLEIARSPVGWWSNSEEFYTAGSVLLEEKKVYTKRYYEEVAGKQVTEKDKEIRRIAGLSVPIIFNLSFSCELLVKAILVQMDPEKWIPETGAVKFGHDVYHLIVDEIGIELTELETKIAKRLADYISYGKYPERVRPGNVQESHSDLFDYHPYVGWSLSEFFEIIGSLRGKLRVHFLELDKKKNS